jgi:hypothetical protein
MSEMGKQPTSGRWGALFGAGEQRWRQCNAKVACRLQIDGRLEFGRLHDRQLRRLISTITPLSIQGDGRDKSRTNRFTKDEPCPNSSSAARGHLVAHIAAIS